RCGRPASPGGVFDMGMGVDPGGDLRLDGLGQQPPGPLPEEISQGVLGVGRWPGDRQGSRLSHGGVLLGHFGRLVVSRFTKGTPPKSNLHPQLPVIALVTYVGTRAAISRTAFATDSGERVRSSRVHS